MNKRPGRVKVTTEVAYCSFCARPRTLRREERQLGTLVRTTVTCETCHRTLSSTISVVTSEGPATEAAEVKASAVEVAEETPKTAAPPKRTPSPKAAAAKPKTATTKRTTRGK
jgi:hypothetical protein